MSLLCFMAVNFIMEGLTIYGPSLAEFSRSLAAIIDEKAGRGSDAVDSCCSALPPVKKSTCGCSCCGDFCPMGDACQCDENGQGAKHHEGLFFRMPSCHPFGPPGTATYLPMSMQVVALPMETIRPVITLHFVAFVYPDEILHVDHFASPPVPPPESVVAASA